MHAHGRFAQVLGNETGGVGLYMGVSMPSVGGIGLYRGLEPAFGRLVELYTGASCTVIIGPRPMGMYLVLLKPARGRSAHWLIHQILVDGLLQVDSVPLLVDGALGNHTGTETF